MAFVNDQKTNPKFQNYVSAIVALNIAGESLETFTKNGIQQAHDTMKPFLVNLPQCTKQCSQQINNPSRWCNTCQTWKEQLEKFHRRPKQIKWQRLHSWLWSKDATEIVEVFLNTHTLQPNMKDLSTIFSLWNNCREFDEQIANKTQSLRDERNSLFHNKCEITSAKRDKILNDVKTLLSEQSINRTISNYDDILRTLNDLQRQDVWFDQQLVVRSMKELIEHQHRINQEGNTYLEELVQKLIDQNEQKHKKKNRVVLGLHNNRNPLLVVFSAIALVLGCIYQRHFLSNTDPSPGIIKIYGCLQESPPEAIMQSNFSMEGYLSLQGQLHGRQWLFKDVEHHIFKPNVTDHGVVLVAQMGYGKTAIMAHLICAQIHQPGALVRKHLAVYHICRFQSQTSQNVGLFIQRIISMISVHLSNYSDFLRTDNTCFENYQRRWECEADMFGCFDQCVLFPLRQVVYRNQEPLVIAIDALDECVNEVTGENKILKLIDRRIHILPKWIRFFITSRNIPGINFISHAFNIMSMVSDDPRNIQDIKSFLEYHNTSYDLNHPGLNFQYLSYIISSNMTGKHLNSGANDVQYNSSINEIKSLHRSYSLNFERVFGEDYELGMILMSIICASDEPLDSSTLSKTVKLSKPSFRNNDVKKTIGKLNHFVNVVNGKLHLIHVSLKEWLEKDSGPYQIDKQIGHHAIATYLIHELLSSNHDLDIVDLLLHISKSSYANNLIESYRRLSTTDLLLAESSRDPPIYHRIAQMTNEGRLVELAYYHFKDIHVTDHKSLTAVYTAVVHGNDKVLSTLVRLGADINIRVAFPELINIGDVIDLIEYLHLDYGLLDVAAQNGHYDIVDYLIKNDSYDFTKRNGAQLLPIHLACKYGHLKIVYLLHQPFSWMLDDVCLYYSALYGFEEIVKYCLDNDKLDTCMPCNQSIYWISENHVRMQGKNKGLVSRAVYCDDWRYINCETALHVAVVGNYTNIVQLLIEKNGSTLRCVDRSGKTPFMYAIIHDHQAIGSLIMENINYDPFEFCNPFSMLLNTSLLSGNEILKLKHNRCPWGFSQLHLSAQYDRTWFIERINSTVGYYSDDRDEYGCHPLHYAACRGSLKILKMFSEVDAQKISDLACNNGSRLIHSASICGSMESIEFLQKYFMPTVVDKLHRTVAIYAVMKKIEFVTAHDSEYDVNNTAKVIETLLNNKHDLRSHDSYGRTVVHYAVANGHFTVVDDLIKRFPIWIKHSIRTKDSVGKDPFSYAIAQLQRNNTFRMDASRLENDKCRLNGLKHVMSPTEYTLFVLLLRNSEDYITLNINKTRVLLKLIDRNSFQLFAAVLRCIKTRLTSSDDTRIFEKLLSYDASGLMMSVYALGRWEHVHTSLETSRDPQSDRHRITVCFGGLSKCVSTFEFSIAHFLALYMNDMNQMHFLFANRLDNNPIIELYFKRINSSIYNRCLDSAGFNILERAIQGGNLQLVKFLLDKGFNSSRNINELLLMTIASYKYRSFSNLTWEIHVPREHIIEIVTSNKSSYSVFGKHFLNANDSIITYVDPRIHYDRLAQYLIQYFKYNISKECICSPKLYDLSLIHYFAIQNFRFSIETAVKYFGKSVLSCTNKQFFTPLYFAKLFNSSDVEKYIDNRKVKLQMPDLVAENNLIFKMKTKFYFNNTLYEACFPYRGGGHNMATFRRAIIMVRCVRKLLKLYGGFKDKIIMARVSRFRNIMILQSNFKYLQGMKVSVCTPRYCTKISVIDSFIAHMLHQTHNDEMKCRSTVTMGLERACKVMGSVVMTNINITLRYKLVTKHMRKLWLKSLRELRNQYKKMSLEMMCRDIYFLNKNNNFHQAYVYFREYRNIVNSIKTYTLLSLHTVETVPYFHDFFVERLKEVLYSRSSLPLVFDDYFNNIKHTTTYKDIFIFGYLNITSIASAFDKTRGAKAKQFIEMQYLSKENDYQMAKLKGRTQSTP